MKKVLLATIFASAVAMAGEANATAAAPAASAGPDGAALYGKCAGCHGAKGEKKALGKSEVITGWDVAKTEEALKGYKAGTRNVHGMGGVMKGQVAAMNDEQIKALAEYINKLK